MKEKKLDCKTAKKIDIISYLKNNGFTSVKISGNNVWFLSPFRRESTASFKVNTLKNVWYDFGEGKGGTIIDLVTKLNHCDVKEALRMLDNSSFSFHQQTNSIADSKKYTINKVIPLSNNYLLEYISQRKINLEIAKKYCYQVHYSFTNQKEYYGIGFLNDLGGFEIRNEFFKGCLGKKAITSINNNSKTTSMFESWSDFLSYQTLKNGLENENFIVLNSTSMINKAIELIRNQSEVKCFLDNDIAGTKAFISLKENSTNKITNCSDFYKNYKDLNDFLIHKNNHQHFVGF